MNLSQSTILCILLGFEVDLHLVIYQFTYSFLKNIEYFGKKWRIIMISVLCPEIHPMVLEYDIFGEVTVLWPINIKYTFSVGFKPDFFPIRLRRYLVTNMHQRQHEPVPKLHFWNPSPALKWDSTQWKINYFCYPEFNNSFFSYWKLKIHIILTVSRNTGDCVI